MRRRFHTPQPAPKTTRRKSNIWNYAALIAVASLIGFLSQIQWVGALAIGIYAVFALWRRIPSRLTFIVALFALGLVPVAIVFDRWYIAQNFGSYSFLLFMVGVFSLTFELRREIYSLRNMHNDKQKRV
ncbi:hypothetical protein TM7_0239 [candidate division TM7 genomosp. GTL1]|nr:hypothetical protein TM7_0239 [candidate division TM7 genomosp. GTL1]